MITENEEVPCCEDDATKTKGFGWKVSLSILAGVGWLVFLIIWLFFYASEYHWTKNVAIFLMSIAVIGVILGIPWAYWARRYQKEEEKLMWKIKGFRWRVWLSAFLVIALMGFLVYWFWYLAQGFSLYQNIAIFIVSILIMGGIMGAAWAPWGMKYGSHFEKKK